MRGAVGHKEKVDNSTWGMSGGYTQEVLSLAFLSCRAHLDCKELQAKPAAYEKMKSHSMIKECKLLNTIQHAVKRDG